MNTPTEAFEKLGVKEVFGVPGMDGYFSKHHCAGLLVHPAEADGQGWKASRDLLHFPHDPSTEVVVVGSLSFSRPQ